MKTHLVPAILPAALLSAVLVNPLCALPPREPGDGSPVPPCADVNIAVGNPKLELRGLPLRGCTVEISAGASKISLIRDLCHDPVYYDLRPTTPIRWELVSFPTGLSTPSFSGNSTLASLSLPRAGAYVVRFTICPSENCTFQQNVGGVSYPLHGNSEDITIVAVDAIPIPAEKYPVLPPSATVATQPTDFPDKNCLCQGGGGAVDPQWVTTADWDGPQDYEMLEGSVFKAWISRQDNPLNHHSQDFNFAVTPDPPFRYLLSTEPEFDSAVLGVEWERGSWPERFRPSYGDRVSLFGYWILDCGHPPFYTEIHPPVGVAVHRPRPIALPSNRSFVFSFPDGDVTSTVGNNVYVPGIRTEIWFNRNSGETTSNCSRSGLHQPGRCNDCNPGQQNCPPYIGGPCIDGKSLIDRIYEFNIYLPKNPAVNAANQGLSLDPPPLYFRVTNPWSQGGSDPVITPVTEGEATYLRVSLDLRGFSSDTYSRRIEAAWVLPAPDNWGLNRWRVTFPTLEVHNDHDPWTDWPNDDGDWRFWMNLNNGEQEWIRILDGDDNAHGTMNFNPPWESGDSDPIFWRSLGSLDSLQRLGPDVLSYPDQGVYIGTTTFEDDWFVGDDPGRISQRMLGPGTRLFRSSKGSYSILVEVQPGPPLNEPGLTTAASRLHSLYRITCNDGRPWLPERPVWTHPVEAAGFLTPGIADKPPWTVEPNVAAALGTAVAGVGDVNGDGLDDFLVGAPKFSVNGGQAGQASLYLGFPGELSTAPYWTAIGEGQGNENVLFGQSVASAGDVNGDGLADFLVGAPSYSNDQADEGAAYLWLGGTVAQSSNASPAGASWMVEGNQDVALLGWTVASAGDVNGDGYDDVAIGAPFFNNNVIGGVAPTPSGRVFVYLGSSNGLSTVAHRALAPGILPNSVGWFGYSLAGADLNNDGFSELVVGMPRYSNGQTDEGELFIYRGSTNGLTSPPIGVAQLNRFGAMLGWSVAAAGDVNGDGYQDIVAGAPNYFFDDVFLDQGAAFLYLGSVEGLISNPVWGAYGPVPGALLGSSVAGVGDLDGDGLADVVVGAPGTTLQQSEQGAILVFRGANGPSGLHETAIWGNTGPRPVAHLGEAVSAAGDVNHDGFSDFIVGAPTYENGQDSEGAAFLYFGCGPREIQPAETRFFRSVGPEQYALFNLVETNFQQLLDDSLQNDPAKLDGMLDEIREELMADVMGSPLEPDALALLEELQRYVPAEVWQTNLGDLALATGGALYLNCGATNEIVDALGRRWKPDAPFLATAESSANPFNNQPVDTSLLSDPKIPNNALLSERWKDGDLQYEVPIQNGLHTVVFYLSENCPACVNPNLGGTGPAGTARIFDLQVEGQRVNGYNPADAALPPDGDGIGATFKATEVVFRDVMVSDGALNVALLDRGSGNPPENASIKAMAILQQAAPGGRVAPRIKAIRRVENAFEIQVDPGPNLAAYFTGFADFKLEMSTNLDMWSDTGLPVGVLNHLVIFEAVPAGPARFYRVVTTAVHP